MRTKHNGIAAIELAIILPLLLAIFFAITEFGRALYIYNSLAKSVRASARFLSGQQPDDSTAIAIAKNIAANGTPVGGQPLVPGLTTAMVRVCNSTTTSSAKCPTSVLYGSNPAIQMVWVTIDGYQFQPILDILAFTRFFTNSQESITQINFGPISAAMRQRP